MSFLLSGLPASLERERSPVMSLFLLEGAPYHDLRNMATALLLVPLAPPGVWAGMWLTRRVKADWAYRIVYTGMGLTGIKLLWAGLR